MLVWLLIQYILTHYIVSSNRGRSSGSSYDINHTVVPSYHLVFLFWLKTFQIRWSHFAIWEVWNPIDKISFFKDDLLNCWFTVPSFYCHLHWILNSEQSRVRVLKSRDSTFRKALWILIHPKRNSKELSCYFLFSLKIWTKNIIVEKIVNKWQYREVSTSRAIIILTLLYIISWTLFVL